MSNYKEADISGTEYQRARLVSINNELDRPKTVTFVEELVSIIGNTKLHRDIGQIEETFSADTVLTEIPLLNPETGEQIGATMTYQQLYVALHSLYMFLANRRDNAPVEEPQP